MANKRLCACSVCTAYKCSIFHPAANILSCFASRGCYSKIKLYTSHYSYYTLKLALLKNTKGPLKLQISSRLITFNLNPMLSSDAQIAVLQVLIGFTSEERSVREAELCPHQQDPTAPSKGLAGGRRYVPVANSSRGTADQQVWSVGPSKDKPLQTINDLLPCWILLLLAEPFTMKSPDCYRCSV